MLDAINVDYLKELQAEKKNLENTAIEETLKGHAMKLLENGKPTWTNWWVWFVIMIIQLWGHLYKYNWNVFQISCQKEFR